MIPSALCRFSGYTNTLYEAKLHVDSKSAAETGVAHRKHELDVQID